MVTLMDTVMEVGVGTIMVLDFIISVDFSKWKICVFEVMDTASRKPAKMALLG